MTCEECKFWVNDKCTDDEEYTDAEGNLCCRFHPHAKKDNKMIRDQLAEDFKGLMLKAENELEDLKKLRVACHEAHVNDLNDLVYCREIGNAMQKRLEKFDALTKGWRVKEKCERCEGTGKLSYNPNLNPNQFEGLAFMPCSVCSNTGTILRELTEEEKIEWVTKKINEYSEFYKNPIKLVSGARVVRR